MTNQSPHHHPNPQVFAEDGEEVWRKQENLALGAVSPFSQLHCLYLCSTEEKREKTQNISPCDCIILPTCVCMSDIPPTPTPTTNQNQMQTFVQTVVSTGGGIMTRRENLPFLHSGLIVWLDLPPDGIVERMKASGEIAKRPILANVRIFMYTVMLLIIGPCWGHGMRIYTRMTAHSQQPHTLKCVHKMNTHKSIHI